MILLLVLHKFLEPHRCATMRSIPVFMTVLLVPVNQELL